MQLTVTNSAFTPATTIVSSQVNQNFSDITTWANGNIQQDNLGTLSGVVSWSISSSSALACSIATASLNGAILIASTGILSANKSILDISSSVAQTTGVAGSVVTFSNASSTIPLFKAVNSGTGPGFHAIGSSTGDLFKGGTASADYFKVDSTGAIAFAGARTLGWSSNIGFARATTSTANDSIKITGADGTALSATNPGYVCVPSSVTPGQLVVFRVTADVTIKLSAAHWGIDTLGDYTNMQIRVYAVNDTASLKWAVGIRGGKTTIVDTDTTTTQASVTTSAKFLVNSALNAGTWPCYQFGWFNANFTDSSNVWAVNNSAGDLNWGVPVPTQTDATSYSLTIGGSVSSPTKGTTDQDLAVWWRRGDRMYVRYEFSQTGVGNPGSGAYFFPLPSGYQIDSTKNYAASSSGHGSVGHGLMRSGSNTYFLTVLTYSTTAVSIKFLNSSGSDLVDVGGSNASLSTATTVYSFEFSVPILGWSGN